MSEPVSLLLIALAAGVKGAGGEAGKDAYKLLKKVIIAKYGWPASAGLDDLERDPKSVPVQNRVVRTLESLGVDGDPEIIRLAAQLTALIERGSDAQMQSDPVERSRRAAGFNAVVEILNEQVQKLRYVQYNYPVDDSDLLSARISQAHNIPRQISADLSTLHARIRATIEQMALHIEDGKYADAEAVVRSLHNFRDRDRATRLLQADKQLRVSYEALRCTVDFFSEFNQDVLRKIQSQPGLEEERQMLFGNAILIYELADFVIGYIENFRPAGFDDLNALHVEACRRVEAGREKEDELEASAKRETVQSPARDAALKDIEHRREALDVFEQEWQKYIKEAKDSYNQVAEVNKNIPTLEVIRDNAMNQIDVLELMSMLGFLRQNAESVRYTVEKLQGFRLAPLTPSRVRRLIGVRN
jgi:hypothetical protein